jgi:hypothetical protein
MKNYLFIVKTNSWSRVKKHIAPRTKLIEFPHDVIKGVLVFSANIDVLLGIGYLFCKQLIMFLNVMHVSATLVPPSYRWTYYALPLHSLAAIRRID